MTNNDMSRRKFALQTTAGIGAILAGKKATDMLRADNQNNAPIQVGIYQTKDLYRGSEELDFVSADHPAQVTERYLKNALEHPELQDIDYEIDIKQDPVDIDEDQALAEVNQEWSNYLKEIDSQEDSNILLTEKQYDQGAGVAETGNEFLGFGGCGGSNESSNAAVLGSGILLNWLDDKGVRAAEAGRGTEDPAAVAIGAINKLGYNLCLDSSYGEIKDDEATPMALGEIDQEHMVEPAFSRESMEQILENYD